MQYNIKPDLEASRKSMEDAKAIFDNANAEQRAMTKEENERFDKLMLDHQEHESTAERKRSLNKTFSDEVENVEKIAERTGSTKSEVENDKEMSKRCLISFLLRGENGMSRDEVEFMKRDQSSGVNSEGGYTVDTFIGDKIIEALKNFGGMRSVSDVISTSTGGKISYPTNNDTANIGRWLSENSTATQTDLVFGSTDIDAWVASSDYIPVSRLLIQDSAFNIDEFVVKQLSTRLSRISNLGYTTGTGSSQPNGVVTDSSFGTAAAAVGATTFSEMLDLKHSVDRDYRVNANWMFNDTTLLALKKISITSTNQSLWQAGIIGGAPATIDGDTYVVNNDMPTMAAGNRSILYGDFSHYLIRDVQGINIRKSDHVNFLKNQVTFLGELRTDGKLLDTSAVKHMRMSNT